MATKKITESINTDERFVIQCEPRRELSCGYTKVKIMPNNYSKIVLIAGMTGKSIQDISNDLIEYALTKTDVKSADTVISVSEMAGR